MLTFDFPSHRYAWQGRRIPSVTQCLEPLFDFGSIPVGVLERKRIIGTQVHAAIEAELLGEPVTITWPASTYFDAYRRFRDECHFEPILTEFRVTNAELGERFRYGGTLDAWGMMNHQPALIDWKTCLVLNDAAIGAQTAAYLRALVRMDFGAKLSARRFALQLGADGRYKLERYRALDDDWRNFCYRLKEHVTMEEMPSWTSP